MKESKKVVGDDDKSTPETASATHKSGGWLVSFAVVSIIVGIFTLLAGIFMLLSYLRRSGENKQVNSSPVNKVETPKAEPIKREDATVVEAVPEAKGDEWTAFYGRDIHWFHISEDGSSITDTTLSEGDSRFKATYTGITENASVVRRGLAFFFSDFESNCHTHRADNGDWIVDKKNDFIKMSNDEMKNFRNSLAAIPGMKNFIPEVLSPRGTTQRTDGKPNNRTGEYRIDPCPGDCLE